MTTTAPDIFTNVHKGIRKALFEACAALGRAGEDPERSVVARKLLRDALRFVAHHGENEDVLLVPLLEATAGTIAARMRAGHEGIDRVLGPLMAAVDVAPTNELYGRTCELVAVYLEHMGEEERALEPGIRAALTVDALVGFGRASVERTAPADQAMMLGWMLPAMTREDAEGFLGRLPPAVAERLRPLARDE